MGIVSSALLRACPNIYPLSGYRIYLVYEHYRTLTQLLAELDGFDPLDNVKVIATTNRIDILAPAILRPGRFDRIIHIPLPDRKARKEIFRVHTRRLNIKEEVDLAA